MRGATPQARNTREPTVDRRPGKYYYRMAPSPEGTLGTVIREERLRRNLRQTELGEIVGLGQAQISAIERGAVLYPNPATLRRIEDVFGFQPGTLYGLAGMAGAKQLAKAVPPPGSMVVLDATGQPIGRLIELAAELNDEDLAELIAQAEFMTETTASHGADQDDDVLHGIEASAVRTA